MVTVVKPGMLTTVQDTGRWGFQARGVPVAGPMDPVSHRAANALVGNARDAALLEITLLGPELDFEDEREVAVAGAEFELSIDGQHVSTETTFTVPAGARLRFGERRGGARAYLAVSGGIAVEPTLGSRATHLVSRMGGVNGRALVAGDRLRLGVRSRFSRFPHGGMWKTGKSRSDPTLRVLPGPQADYFTDDALEVLQSAPYGVGGNSDRMGFRL